MGRCRDYSVCILHSLNDGGEEVLWQSARGSARPLLRKMRTGDEIVHIGRAIGPQFDPGPRHKKTPARAFFAFWLTLTKLSVVWGTVLLFKKRKARPFRVCERASKFAITIAV